MLYAIIIYFWGFLIAYIYPLSIDIGFNTGVQVVGHMFTT